MNRFLKTAVGAALVLLLFAALFCGTVSADPIEISSDDWNKLESISGTEYHFNNSGTQPIQPKFLETKQLELSNNLVLDFTDFDGTFADYSNSDYSGAKNYVGALFGYVIVRSGEYTLTIKNLTLQDVNVISKIAQSAGVTTSHSGGIVGYFEGTQSSSPKLIFENCKLVNCSIESFGGVSSSSGGLVGALNDAGVCFKDCTVQYCNVFSEKGSAGGLVGSETNDASLKNCIVDRCAIASSEKGSAGGLVGSASGGSSEVNFVKCSVENTSIYSSFGGVGGLVGSVPSVVIYDCHVNNCVLATSDSIAVGGLVANPTSVSVKNSDVAGSTCYGSMIVGGFVGAVKGSVGDCENNKVENCAVSGASDDMYGPMTNLVCGMGTISCDITGKNFINNYTEHDTITLKNADGEPITTSTTNFWKVISYTTAKDANEEDAAAVTVTNLGKYGYINGYGVGMFMPPVSYTVTANPETGGTLDPSEGTAQPGKTVTITATPKSGYGFVNWTSSPDVVFADNKSNSTTFTMLAQDVTITANFNITAVASVKDYVYNSSGALPTPTLLPDITADTFYYSDSAAVHDESKKWKTLTSTTLNAGTYYVYAKVGNLESKRGTFKVIPADQNAPEFTVNNESAVVKVTIDSYDSGKSYQYALKESGAPSTTENWVLVSGSPFTLAGLKADTDYKIKLNITESRNYNASSATEQTFKTIGEFTVKYNANGGTGSIASETAQKGTAIIAKSGDGFKRDGYTFYNWKNSTESDVAVNDKIYDGTTLYANWTANEYTINFNPKGGNVGSPSVTVKYDAAIVLPTATYTGYTFAGWAVTDGKSAVYTGGQKVQGLVPSGTKTLYAVWVENPHNITVNLVNAESAIVKLMRGNTTITTKTINSANPSFDNLPPGTYNLVAESGGKTVTSMVILGSSDESVTIKFPTANVNSKVEVSEKENTPAVVVGKLDDEAEAKAVSGRKVTITLAVEAKVEAEVSEGSGTEVMKVQDEISKIKTKVKTDNPKVAENPMQFLEITVKKKVDTEDPVLLPETSNVIELVIPYDFSGKENVKVYRVHDGNYQELTKDTSKNDGTYQTDETNGLLYIYAKKFSIYSVGYTVAGSSPDPQPSSSSSSRDYGASVWLQETPAPTQTPGDVSGTNATQIQPTASPVQPQQQASTPAPFIGLLAGLGAAAVFFGLRRK